MKKKLLAGILAVSLLLCLLPAAALAAADDVFTVDSTDAVPVTVKYKVLSEDAATMTGTVQVGDGMNAAVDVATTTLTLPDTVVNNGITYTVTGIGVGAFQSCTKLTLTALPTGLTGIGAGAFQFCTKLALTALPDGVTSIGNNAFRDCTSLALTALPDGATNIGHGAFANCSSLALTALPDGMTGIDGAVFDCCTSLALTALPAGVTKIGDSAFDNCSSLALTALPDGVTSIGNNAFRGCTSLTLVKVPSGVTFISESMFYSCAGLTRAELPTGVTRIESYAFYSCPSLNSIVCGATVAPSLGLYSVFDGVAATGTLYVPFGATGYTAAGWPAWTIVNRANLSGTVYGTDGTTPVSGATVTVNGVSIRTDSRGRYSFPAALDNGSYTVSASKGTDSGSLDITVFNGNLSDQNITLKAKASDPSILDPAEDTVITVTEGETGTMAVRAENALSFQWEIDRGSGWEDISGATEASYTTSAVALANDGYKYRCTVSGAPGTALAVSKVFTLNVIENAAPPVTGDTNRPFLWAALALLALAGLVFAARKPKSID